MSQFMNGTKKSQYGNHVLIDDIIQILWNCLNSANTITTEERAVPSIVGECALAAELAGSMPGVSKGEGSRE